MVSLARLNNWISGTSQPPNEWKGISFADFLEQVRAVEVAHTDAIYRVNFRADEITKVALEKWQAENGGKIETFLEGLLQFAVEDEFPDQLLRD